MSTYDQFLFAGGQALVDAGTNLHGIVGDLCNGIKRCDCWTDITGKFYVHDPKEWPNINIRTKVYND